MAWLYFRAEKYEEALSTLEEYELNPVKVRDPVYLKILIYNHLWRKDYKFVAKAFNVISYYVGKTGEDVSPYWYFELGLLAKRIGDKESEEMYLQKAIDRGYEDAALFDRYAHILDKKGDEVNALKLHKKAYDLDVHFAHCYGKSLLKYGRVSESLPLLEEAIELEPEEAVCWHDLGVCRDRLGERYLAAYAFEKAIKYDDRYILAYCNLIGVYLTLNLGDQALKWAIHLNNLPGLSNEERGIVTEQFGDLPKNVIRFLHLDSFFEY